MEEHREDQSKRKFILLEGFQVKSKECIQVCVFSQITLRGVTIDQRMAERRRERSQKKAERIRMITFKGIICQD